MTIKRLLPYILLIPALMALRVTAAPDASSFSRTVYDFNSGWRLFVGDDAGASAAAFDDSGWKPVTLPRAWNEDEAFRKDIAELSTGIAWYRKHFTLPAEISGRKVFLEFEGVRQAAEVFVNGRRVGLHENGAMAFGLDVSAAVVPGDNVVAVRTDNDWGYKERATGQKFQWEDRNFNANYGGIPKNVRLHVTGRVYQTLPLFSNLGTTGVYVYATGFDLIGGTATVSVEAEVRNESAAPAECRVLTTVEELDGRVLARFEGRLARVGVGGTVKLVASSRVSGLHFWSWGYGYLYNVRTALEVDERTSDVVLTRTGFRKTAYQNGCFLLNDRVLHLKGYAQRTSNEWPAVGASVPPWLSDYSNGLMVESNANLVRWMHITPWKQDIESCDRVGLLQAMPAGDSEADVKGRRWEQRVELMRDAIVYNRNNPSVIFYESGNKGISEEHMAEMKALRDRYDPHGGRAIGSREMLDSKIAEYGGEMLYINKSTGKPVWAMEYSRDEALRKYWDSYTSPFHKDGDGPLHKGQSAAAYNRNQDSHAIENVVRWDEYFEARPGTGRRVNAGGVNIVFSDTNTHHRGAENYRRSGEVDAMRIPKDGYWAHQVMWDGWVDPERPRIHLIGHWNYEAGTVKPVYVVSSAERVELFLNGRSLGQGLRSSRFLFSFDKVAWEPGRLLAVGYDRDGARVCETELKTAGSPRSLRLSLKTAPGGLLADGADLALVEVEVVDAEGRRCPTALDLVSFELDGPAEWRGGIAQAENNGILSKRLPVECGVTRVLIRSLPRAGRISLSAHAEGLAPASLSWASVAPVPEVGGLRSRLPGCDLPVNLSRGPTPAGASVTPTRQAVEVVAVSAGSEAARASASCDDNEETSWTSGDKLEEAWISYDFGKAVSLNEIVLKLVSWRDRSYPLLITVDGQEVYRGQTPHSLGYVTLPLKPVSGRRLKIQLTSASSEQDVFKITEVKEPTAEEKAAKRPAARALGIVEAEFYAPLP